MKNYPEYPDLEDGALKRIGEECGETDFKRIKAIDDLVQHLQNYAIQSRPLVLKLLALHGLRKHG